MKISEIIAGGKQTLSYEVFPPKTTDKFDSVKSATEKIAAMQPDYMSVTFGAGGSGSRFTLPIAANIEKNYGVPVIHHLTCVGSAFDQIKNMLDVMRENGISNVLALRGDVPDGADPSEWAFQHASDLVEYIRSRGDFCIGGACYPEGHPESASIEEDLCNLRRKVDAGCDFLTTQLFLDNDIFFRFMERVYAHGIFVPVIAGIMPITKAKQFARIETLSGSEIPAELIRIGNVYADDPVSMRKAGLDYAKSQIRSLIDHGVKNIHIYTMNDPEVAEDIKADYFDYALGGKA
ncbi:MAG: methylenetetrahydrofolate reductase [NAD(P)H] [Clostridia bacterium]|nr:methylenetetrahydrofolate reductase [NAD(P)H] [Clostridia bacterium]